MEKLEREKRLNELTDAGVLTGAQARSMKGYSDERCTFMLGIIADNYQHNVTISDGCFKDIESQADKYMVSLRLLERGERSFTWRPAAQDIPQPLNNNYVISLPYDKKLGKDFDYVLVLSGVTFVLFPPHSQMDSVELLRHMTRDEEIPRSSKWSKAESIRVVEAAYACREALFKQHKIFKGLDLSELEALNPKNFPDKNQHVQELVAYVESIKEKLGTDRLTVYPLTEKQRETYIRDVERKLKSLNQSESNNSARQEEDAERPERSRDMSTPDPEPAQKYIM